MQFEKNDPPITSQLVRWEADLSEDHTRSINTSVILCLVISGLSVIASLASRYLKKIPFTMPDWLILGGFASAWATSLVIIHKVDRLTLNYTMESTYLAAGKRGLGKHVKVIEFVNSSF